MNNKTACYLLALLIICAGISSIAGCAGGSRGTGIRFNSGTKSSPLEEDDDDDDDEPVLFRRR